jgi:hypothetical protein
MSKAREEIDSDDDEMRPEYDFSGGIRGRHVERYANAANFVVLDPDVVEVFPDSESVNRALSTLIREHQGRAGTPPVPAGPRSP